VQTAAIEPPSELTLASHIERPAMPGPQYQAKHPVTILAGPYGHPFHPILVTVPIGAWTASLVFDIASRLAHHPGFLAKGSLWLIAVGVIGALAAACTGFLDLSAIPAGNRAHRTALAHMSLNLTVTAAYIAGFAWRYTGHHTATPVPTAQIALSAVSMAALNRVRVPRRQAGLPLRRPGRAAVGRLGRRDAQEVVAAGQMITVPPMLPMSDAYSLGVQNGHRWYFVRFCRSGDHD
jgi:uncharacterized membrane protein